MPPALSSSSASPRLLLPYTLLVLANLFWAGNWITGRALRDDFGPLALTFWRWLIAVAVLAPFLWPGLRRDWPQLWPQLRRHWRLLALLSLCTVVLFQSFVYIGLRSTTAINGVLLNSCIPLFILACSWMVDGEKARPRQLAGMALSFTGIVAIVTRGEPARLAGINFNIGDLWVLAAMPAWALYSVLLRRKPAELGGMALVFVLSAIGLCLLAPAYLAEMAWWIPQRRPSAEALAGLAYIGLFASVGALACWNAGVAAVGASRAGFTVHLLPLFGTLLAIGLLGERLQLFHVAGFAAIIAGVVLASVRNGRSR